MPDNADEWTSWRDDVFGDSFVAWHDGLSVERVLPRWSADPSSAERMLVLGLQRRDPIAASAVEYLVRAGLPMDGFDERLRQALEQSSGGFRVKASEALYAKTADSRLADPVCDVLEGSRYEHERAEAARALWGFGLSPRVLDALSKGVQDDDYLVRRHSAQSLLILAGRSTTIEKQPDLWRLIRIDHDKRAWRQAAADLCAMVP